MHFEVTIENPETDESWDIVFDITQYIPAFNGSFDEACEDEYVEWRPCIRGIHDPATIDTLERLIEGRIKDINEAAFRAIREAHDEARIDAYISSMEDCSCF